MSGRETRQIVELTREVAELHHELRDAARLLNDFLQYVDCYGPGIDLEWLSEVGRLIGKHHKVKS